MVPNDSRSMIVNTPLWRVTDFFPSGEMAIPKGSLVIWINDPAGVKKRPLGKMVVPAGLIFVNTSFAGTVRISTDFCEYPELQKNTNNKKIERDGINFIMN